MMLQAETRQEKILGNTAGEKKVIVLSHYTVIASCTLQCVIKWSSADFPEQTGDYFILRLLFPIVW